MNHNDMYSMKNFDFWRGVSPECTPGASQLIFRPLSAIWMKNIVNGFASAMNCTVAVSSQAEAAH